MASADEILALQTDPVFLGRLTAAFAAAAFAAATAPPDPQMTATQQLAAMNGLRFLIANGAAQAQEDLRKALLFVLGAPAVQAQGAKIDDASLLQVASTLLTLYQRFTALGGSV